MTLKEKEYELRMLNRKIRHLQAYSKHYGTEQDKTILVAYKSQRKALKQAIAEHIKTNYDNIVENAAAIGYILEAVNAKKNIYRLVANWQCSDGAEFCSMPMSLECCRQYLIGFFHAQYAIKYGKVLKKS